MVNTYTYIQAYPWIDMLYMNFFNENGEIGKKKGWEEGVGRRERKQKYLESIYTKCSHWLPMGYRLMGNSFLPHLIHIF